MLAAYGRLARCVCACLSTRRAPRIYPAVFAIFFFFLHLPVHFFAVLFIIMTTPIIYIMYVYSKERRRHRRAGARARKRASASVQGGVRPGANRLAVQRIRCQARRWQRPAQVLRWVSGGRLAAGCGGVEQLAHRPARHGVDRRMGGRAAGACGGSSVARRPDGQG